MRLALVLPVVLAAGSLAASSRQATPRPTPQAKAAAQDSDARARAEAILRQAREALGGEQRLAAVETLVVEGTTERESGAAPYGFRLRMPDRYQSLRSAFTHTLDGPDFWMREDASELVTVTDDMRQAARRSTISRFREDCLEFLLRWPSTFPLEPRALGPVTLGGTAGDAVEFATGQGAVRMLFDATTHMPLLFATRVTSGDTGESTDLFVRLKDYRTVEGLRFPFTLESEIVGRSTPVTRVESIKVNAPLGPGAFKKPGK